MNITDVNDKFFKYRQENLYYNSIFLNCKWYRKIYGGTWYFIKLNKALPDINLFYIWSKLNKEHWNDDVIFICNETYDETFVDTRVKFLIQLLKNICTSLGLKQKKN